MAISLDSFFTLFLHSKSFTYANSFSGPITHPSLHPIIPTKSPMALASAGQHFPFGGQRARDITIVLFF